MRKTDPIALALLFAVAVTLGTCAYVVGSVLADPPTSPVPWSADPVRARETWETIQQGVRVTPPLPPPHR